MPDYAHLAQVLPLWPTLWLTLWGSCMLYLLPLRRRPQPALRPFLLLLLAVGLGLLRTWIPAPGEVLWPGLGCLFCVFFFLVCADGTWQAAIYCGIWAVITQQLATELWMACYQYAEPFWGLGEDWWLVGLVIFAAAYVAVWLTLARWMPQDGRYRVGPRQLTSAVALLLLFEVLFYYLTVDNIAWRRPYIAMILLAQLYCATMLYLQDALFKKSAMRQELQILNRLWYEQKEQYDLSKETIAIINRKCHDLKHQMAAMRAVTSPEEREKYLREIEDSVQIYDSIFKTGNEVLDTVLTEKSLYCEANHITVTCVADGTALGFLDPVDVYSILGNAMDNAIESVQRFQETERRQIDVLICT